MGRLSEANWTHYLYTIRFEDGSYYTGVSCRKGDDPLYDGYLGSPKTNKRKWKEPLVKEVNALLFCEKADEQYQLECEFQKLVCDLNSPLCLNARIGGHFPLEVSKKTGKKNGKDNVRLKRGFFKQDPEYLVRVSAIRSRVGKRNAENGTLAKARLATRESLRKEVKLIHSKTGQKLHLLAINDAKLYGLSPSKISLLVRGLQSQHKGWIIDPK